MLLKEFLEKSDQTPYAFFKKHDLPRDPIYRHLQGKKVDYETAKKISAATGGAVTIADIMGWRSGGYTSQSRTAFLGIAR